MIYMSPHASITKDADPKRWGYILTPKSRTSVVDDGRRWCADNGVFTGQFNWEKYQTWLIKMRPWRSRCVFVTAPDVVGDAVATLERYRYYAWRIKALGFPVALVGQDGLESLPWPPEFDAFFVGGSTEWKMGDGAAWRIRYARQRCDWIHVGRVNSQKRIRHFQLLGVDSADGTSITFAPDREYDRLDAALRQPALLTW